MRSRHGEAGGDVDRSCSPLGRPNGRQRPPLTTSGWPRRRA